MKMNDKFASKVWPLFWSKGAPSNLNYGWFELFQNLDVDLEPHHLVYEGGRHLLQLQRNEELMVKTWETFEYFPTNFTFIIRPK